MSITLLLSTIITAGYYVIAAFFLFSLIKAFIKTKNIQDAILFCLIMMPFILRLLRLK